jgi:site-specific DNA-methyltransferase (adenine-specific)
MKTIPDNSIDLLFCDLPYCGITNSKKDSEISCKWNTPIDLEKFWKQVNRICKERTPMFFTCSTKFGVSLITSNPKNFRYDLVWVKSSSCGFLNAKKMPMKKHEMIYVFYRKLPLYDLSSHKHKFLNETTEIRTDDGCSSLYGKENKKIRYKDADGKKIADSQPRYDPPLPNTVIRDTKNYKNNSELYGNVERPDFMRIKGESVYDPPLPNTLLEVKSEKGKHSTQKPVSLVEWILKYYTLPGDIVLDPTMGSGSSGVACKNMKRNYIGIEMDKDIFAVAEKRLQ